MIAIMPKSIAELFDTGRDIALMPGQSVFRIGDQVGSMFLLTQGQVDLLRHTNTGTALILNRAGSGQVLAEASAYSDKYHCDGVARAPSTLRALPVLEFRERLNSAPQVADIWAADLAHALQKIRLQSEIKSLKTVADRLDAWLSVYRNLPPKGQIQDLAQMLGVSREALYRELARRRKRETSSPAKASHA